MAEVPYTEADDGRVVYDLDAFRAAERDTRAGQFIKIRGIEIALPQADDIPLEAMEWLEAGEVSRVLRHLFGDDYPAVREAGLSLLDVKVIIGLVMGSMGGEPLGESVASTT